MIIGAAGGACKVAINIGGKIFRANFDELNQGLLDVDAGEYFGVLKRPDNLIKLALKQPNQGGRSHSEPGMTNPIDSY